MNERGNIRIPRIGLIVIVLVVVLVVVAIIVGVMVGKQNNQPSNELQNITEGINPPVVENKIENIVKEEEIAQTPLPKVELNIIAEENSTIDGRTPCFYNPVIPKGFKAITVTEDETIDSKAKWGQQNAYLYGLVIEDEKENQFVWIPVENINLFQTTDWQKNTPTGTIDATYIEPKQGEEQEYEKMKQKIKKYGGFYVGRYETGDMTADKERSSVKNSDSVGIQKYLNVYNYVPYQLATIDQRQITGAKELAVQFGKTNGYDTVTTSIMYGAQWDSILRFIVSDTYQVNDSIKWGNYSTSELTYTDKIGNTYLKKQGEVRLLKTGSSEATKAKNIYDIAGNAYEWTMESSGNTARIVRGGSYVVNIGQLAAARYAYHSNTANNAIGFRISFYIH